MNRKLCLSIGFAVSIGLLLTADSSRAVSIPLVNPSFELDVLDTPPDPQDGSYTLTESPGWTADGAFSVKVTQNVIEAQYTNGDDAGPTLGVPLGGDGRQSLAAATFDSGYTGYWRQVTGATLEAGHTYELTVAVGHQLDRAAMEEFYIGMYAPDFAQLFSVRAGTASDLTPGQFVDFSTSFTATPEQAGLSLMVYFEGKSPAGLESFLRATGFDKVRLEDTSDVEGLPGDYSGNGTVDAADYTVWRDGGPLQNEVDGITPGSVTQEDYDAWKARFGNNSGAASGGSATAAVPEPACWSLAVIALFGSLGIRRRWLATV